MHLLKVIQKNQNFPACKLFRSGVVPDALCVSASAQLRHVDFTTLLSDLTPMNMDYSYQLICQCLIRQMDLTNIILKFVWH